MANLLFILILLINARQSLCNFGVYITKHPETTIAPKGDEVIFECGINLIPDNLIWRHAPLTSNVFHDINATSESTDDSTFAVTTKGTSSKLRVLVRNDETSGYYQCVVWFGASALASIPAKLTIGSLGEFKVDNGQNEFRYTVSPGNDVALMCPDVQSNPKALIQFFHKGKQIPSTYQKSRLGTLMLPNVQSSTSGRYSCSALNDITGEFTKTSVNFDLTVAAGSKHGPRFLKMPPTVYDVKVGENVTLECSAIGNPVPSVTWTHENSKIIFRTLERHRFGAIGLEIINVTRHDHGVYTCKITNHFGQPIIHRIQLNVQEPPVIVNYTISQIVDEGYFIELDCETTGIPKPEVYWLLNGNTVQSDESIKVNNDRITINPVKKRHAGIVQCFARNVLGEVSKAELLKVSPKQISNSESHGEIPDVIPHMTLPTHKNKEHRRKNGRRKDKKHKGNYIMVPPSRPNVTRLSDESVMVRWSVPENDGLPIQFFKLQYRDITDSKGPRKDWTTTNDDIPPHINSYEVNNLEPDHVYRFHIAAVYSNNDNKVGLNSEKFHLHRAAFLGRKTLPAPTLLRTEALGPTAIKLHWQFISNPAAPVQGFYAYYRQTSNAGEYVKAAVIGQSVRSLKLDCLTPDTPYEIKVQSFTENEASDFSAILTQKTMKNVTDPPPTPVVDLKRNAEPESTSMAPIIGGAIGGCFLLILSTILWVIFKRRKQRQATEQSEDKFPDPESQHHISTDTNGYPPQIPNGYSAKCNKNNRAQNGGNRVNITANPLAEDQDDKNTSLALTDIEMSLLSQNNNCSGASSSTNGVQSSTQDPDPEETTLTETTEKSTIPRKINKKQNKNEQIINSNSSIENYV